MIINILIEEKIHNQEELQRRLQQDGDNVTQATLSRDLKFLGVARVPDPVEGYIYIVKENAKPTPEPYLRDDISRSIIDIHFSGNLAVIKTKLGHGHSVGFAIDRLDIPYIIGTLGGEDTLLVIFSEGADKCGFVKSITGRDSLHTD